MTYLLQVNVLIAAIWKNHPDHSKVDAWLEGKEVATCPISQLGFLRISTNPKALNATMATSRQLLESFLRKRESLFIADDLLPLKSSAQRSDHVTDFYLAELAASREMKLATLDAGISHRTVVFIA